MRSAPMASGAVWCWLAGGLADCVRRYWAAAQAGVLLGRQQVGVAHASMKRICGCFLVTSIALAC